MSGKNVTEVVQADEAGIERAARILSAGGIVAVPTETVYGLAARADSAEAVAKIYAAKGRPDFNPLIVHIFDIEQARRCGVLEGAREAVAMGEWPGPLTMVVPLADDAKVAPAVTAGLGTIALRVPGHPVMRALLERCDFPLAAPSANRSGFISPTSAAHVLTSLDGRIDMILDGGVTQAGLESTILTIRNDDCWQVLRPGPISEEHLRVKYFGGQASDLAENAGKVEAPGQLASHYAPGKPMRLNVTAPEPDEFMIGFGEVRGDCMLAESSLEQAAAQLYDCLHRGAASPKPKIAVAPISEDCIGTAINDRLRRAAAD